MELSIIIPVYNAEQTLHRCVESVLGQPYADDEIILVDDGSTDGSAVLCDELSRSDNRVRVIHQANGGLGSARNTGLDSIKGRFVTFVDADDYIGSDTLRAVMDAVKQHSSCDIFEYPMLVHYGGTRQHLLTFQDEEVHDMARYWFAHRGYLHSYVCNKVFRAELFRGIRFPVDQVFEDLITTARLLSLSRGIATIGQGLYYYVATPNSITVSAGVRELEQLLTANLDAIRRYIPTTISSKDRAIHYLHLVNIRLDLYRRGKTDISLPRVHIPICVFMDRSVSLSTKLKAFIIKTIGETALCKLYPRRK